MSWTEITSADELTALIGEPTPAAANKVRTTLHEIDRQWLAASPFCLVATSDAEGNCDVSPKGDPAGQLVHVIDDSTIVLAERPGNRRADGYRNILANPHVGLIFFSPGRNETVRINGRAKLVSEAPFFDDLIVKGHRPLLALVVEIDEIFHHCAKAFLRSKLWDRTTWHPEQLPTRAVTCQILERPEESLENLQAYYGPSYAEHLYG